MPSWTLLTALLMWSILAFTGGVEIGCIDWDAAENDQVCCKECHTGNRRVDKCGIDPEKLCTPCKNGTYTKTKSAWSCDRCNQCVDPQIELKPCHGTTDTVCGCKPEYRCFKPDCLMCMRECGKGQEPVDGHCKECPKGTFNDQIHHLCVSWTKCPSGQVIVTEGTAFSDNKCDISNEINQITVPQIRKRSTTLHPIDADDQNMPLVWSSLAMLCLFFILGIFAIFRLIVKRNKTSTKVPITELPKTPEPHTLMTVEQEECSFCRPQQEQGSFESLSTVDSMDKLLPPV
ncbi:tumor necrosis factor receptor superfamily member 9a [Clupea harengus]|uniref:Tumor necrosis factor receptor superfamily member 9a n=1 Tax=Clupea harengus TaxID=7950 RepID=A0A6P8FGY4_CLUHA|nr:tumor necrosis factor receptor superfamily member 9a [Clupea harengus]